MLNEKATIILLKVGWIKKISFNKMSYFPEPYTLSKNKIKAELNLSNYATKLDLKMQQVVLIHRDLLKRLI